LHNSEAYLNKNSFDYEAFKKDYIAKVEMLETIRQPLIEFTKAIHKFYEDIKDFDTNNVIKGYFDTKPF
jgi:hypothetical protein